MAMVIRKYFTFAVCMYVHQIIYIHKTQFLRVRPNWILFYILLRSIYYDIQDSEDVEQVCVAIQSKNGSYDTAHVGNYDTYNYKGNLNGQDDWEWDTGKEGQRGEGRSKWNLPWGWARES